LPVSEEAFWEARRLTAERRERSSEDWERRRELREARVWVSAGDSAAGSGR